MKQPITSSLWLRVTDPEAARIVTDIQARRFLDPLVGQERTVAGVAGELQVHMSSVLYRVRQFLRLGLIEQTRLETRKGRAVRHYRSAADGFFVPFAATPLATEEALSPHAFGHLQRTLNQSIGQAWVDAAGEGQRIGFHLFRNHEGVLIQNIVPDPDAAEPDRFFKVLREPQMPAVWDTWGLLRLAHEDAKALQSEIATLLEHYYPKVVQESGSEYIVRLAMAPLKP